MRLTYALFALGLAAACGDDDYPTPSGGLDGRTADAPSVDANVDTPDADPSTPDADPSTPDALPPDAMGSNDRLGPTITVTNPLPEARLIAGILTLTFTVTDPDGVVLESVGASIRGSGNVPIPFEDLVPSGENQWTGTFDTRILAGRVFPVIHIVATDRPGNRTELGVQISLDNVGPLAELDPPPVREYELVDGVPQCSISFDPVGDDAPNDGSAVAQFVELRARIIDLPNTGTQTSNVVLPLADIDDARVELLVLDDSDLPLVVDTDGDPNHVCDAINPDVVPTPTPTASNEAALVNMAPLTPAGASYKPTLGSVDARGPNDAGFCREFPDEDNVPQRLCAAGDNVPRIVAVSGGTDDMIYAPPSVLPDACMGDFFDAFGANMSDGWACVAIRVTDRKGNVNVSKPLRICIDADQQFPDGTRNDPTPECHDWGTSSLVGAPSCTGTVVGDEVTTTPCVPAYQYPRLANGDVERIEL
jgi:hypothetical protein